MQQRPASDRGPFCFLGRLAAGICKSHYVDQNLIKWKPRNHSVDRILINGIRNFHSVEAIPPDGRRMPLSRMCHGDSGRQHSLSGMAKAHSDGALHLIHAGSVSNPRHEEGPVSRSLTSGGDRAFHAGAVETCAGCDGLAPETNRCLLLFLRRAQVIAVIVSTMSTRRTARRLHPRPPAVAALRIAISSAFERIAHADAAADQV